MNGEGVNRPRSKLCSIQMSDEGKGENEAKTSTSNSVKCPTGIISNKDGGNITDDELSNLSKIDMSPSKNYRIPKLLNHPELLSEVTLSSYEFQNEVLPKVSQYFYYNSSEMLTIKKCCLVNNSDLTTKFSEKKKAMKNDGYSEKELSEMFGFIYARKEDLVSEAIKHGLKVGNKESSLIGHPQMGIHLSRFVDIIPVTTTNSSLWFGQIIMFKFLKGRVKTVPLNTTGSHSDPTPNYDCHVNKPVAIETKNMTEQQILDQNQIYLYEYNDEGRIMEYPRHLVPYAVLDVILKPIHSVTTLNSPLGKKFGHSWSPLTGSSKYNSAKEEYIVWNGKLSLKGSYACNVTMMSSAGYFKPVRLGSNINICNRSEVVRAEEKYFNKLNGLNKCQETFWRRRYINITELKPKPGSVDHFHKITKYLLEKNCLAIVKPDSNTVLFLIPSCSLTAKLGLSSTECNKYERLYCLFLSKQSAYLNSPQYTYCMFKTTGKVPGIDNCFPTQQLTIITDSTDKCDHNILQIYPCGIRTPVKNHLGSMNIKNQFENESTFSSPQKNIHAPFSPRLLVNSPLLKTPSNNLSPYLKSPVYSPWHGSKAFDNFTKPISNDGKLKLDKVVHTFDCQYSLELYEMTKSFQVQNSYPHESGEVTKLILNPNGDQNTSQSSTISCKIKLEFEESKPDISKMKQDSCDNITYIPNSGDPCLSEHLSPEVASAKLNFPKLYSGISSEDNSTDIESIGTDLDSPTLDPQVSGITTVNNMKVFLNETVKTEQNKCTKSDVSKEEEVPLVANIESGSEACPEDNPPTVASKKHDLSLFTSTNTIQTTRSMDICTYKDVERDGYHQINLSYEDQMQTSEIIKERNEDNCSSSNVANMEKQSPEDDCLLQIANQVSERCSQSDSSDEDEGCNANQLAFKTVTKLSKSTLPTYIDIADSTRPTEGIHVKNPHIRKTFNDPLALHAVKMGYGTAHGDEVPLKKPLVQECANKTPASTETVLKSDQKYKTIDPSNKHNSHQDLQNSDCYQWESPEDEEVRLCMADIQNQIEISVLTKLRITPEMPTLSILPSITISENVTSSMPVLEKSYHDDNTQSKCDSDTINTPSAVDNQRASPDINFFSSSDILKVCKNASQPGPIIHKADITSNAGVNSCKDLSRPLKISIPEEDLDLIHALPDKFIPRYSSDEEVSCFDTSGNKGTQELTLHDFPPSKNSDFVLDILDSTSTGFLDEDMNPPSDSVSSFTLEEDLTSEQESKLDKCVKKATDENKSIQSRSVDEICLKKDLCKKDLWTSTLPVLPIPQAECSQQNKTKTDCHNANIKITVLNPYKSINKIQFSSQDKRIVEIGPSNNENTTVKSEIITEAIPPPSGIESDVDNGESSALSDFQNFMDNSDYQVVDEVYSSDETEIYYQGKSGSAEICKDQITDKKTDMPVSLAEQTRTNKNRNIYSLMNKSLDETKNDAQLSHPVVNLTRCDSPNSPFNVKKLFPSKPFNELFSESIRKIKLAKSSNKLKLSKQFDNDDQNFLSKLEPVCDDSDNSSSTIVSHKSASTCSKSPHRSKHLHSKSKDKDEELLVNDTVSSHTDLSKHDRKSLKDIRHKTDKHSTKKSSSEQTSLGKHHHHHKKSKKHSKTKSDTVLEKTSRETSPHKSRHKKLISSTFKLLEPTDEEVKSKRDSHRRSRSDDVVTNKSDDRKSKHSKKHSKTERSVHLVISPSKSPNVLSIKDKKTIEQIKGTPVTNFTIPKTKVTKSKENKTKPKASTSIENLKLERRKLPKDEIFKTKLITSALTQAGIELKKTSTKKVESKKMSKVVNVKDIGKKVEQNLAEQLKGSNSIVEKFLLISTTNFPDVKDKDDHSTELSSKSGPAKDDKKNRKFHPYNAPKASRKKQWASFDLPVSDLKALMQDLTTYSYRSYNQPINHDFTRGNRYLRRHERRFSNYVFKRSEVPADDEEVKCDFDADDFIDYEERKKQAELVDQPLDEENKIRHHKDDFLFEEELRLYSGHSEKEEGYTGLHQSAITDKILKEENTASIEIMASPTNSVGSGVKRDAEEATNDLMDLESEDDFVAESECASDIGAAIADAIPGLTVISASSVDNISSEESLTWDTGTNVKCIKPNVPLRLEKSNTKLDNKVTSDHFYPNTCKESAFSNTAGDPVPFITEFKTDANTLKISPELPKMKDISFTDNIKQKYSPEASAAEKTKRISVQIGHAFETIPHIPSDIRSKPSPVINPNLIEVPLCTEISSVSVTTNKKQEIDEVNYKTDICNKSTNFSLDQNFPKSATFLKVDQDLLSKVSKTIFQSDSSADENFKENVTHKIHARSSEKLIPETNAEMKSLTSLQNPAIDESIHIPLLEKKKTFDLSIRNEVIDDLESMRNLLNCDLTPSHSKGYSKDFQIQTISYDSGIRPKPVPFHKQMDQIIPKPMSAISHDIVIKPISNNLKTSSTQFQSDLPNLSSNTGLLCFTKPSTFQFGSKETNMAIFDSRNQIAVQNDGSFSSDSSTPVKDEMLTSSFEFGTPLKDEVPRNNKSTIITGPDLVTHFPSGNTKPDLNVTPCLDPNIIESHTKAKHTNDVHNVMMSMWKKITSRPDPRTVSPMKEQSSFSTNVNSSEETDSEDKQFKLKLHDPRKASPRKIKSSRKDDTKKLAETEKDVAMKTKSQISPIIVDMSTHTDTDKIQPTSEVNKNTLKKSTSAKKDTVKKARHISGVHPKCKDYWQHTVESITFVNLHIKHVADPALKDLIESKHYFKDPRMEMKKGLIPRNVCPNTGLLVKPKSRGILEKKCPKPKQPTRTVSEGSRKFELQASENSRKNKSTCQNEVQKINSKRSKSLDIDSENLPLILSEKKISMKKAISLDTSSDGKQMTTSVVPCIKETDSQKMSNPDGIKTPSSNDKSKTLIPCGTKRKAENDYYQIGKVSKQEVASNDNANASNDNANASNDNAKSLREELINYALDSKSVSTPKNEKIVLPAFKPVRQDSANTRIVQTCVTSSTNEMSNPTVQVETNTNLKDADDLVNVSNKISDQKALKKPELKPDISSNNVASTCVNVSPHNSIQLEVPHRKDPFLSTNQDDTQSTLNKLVTSEKHQKINTETLKSRDVIPDNILVDSVSPIIVSKLSSVIDKSSVITLDNISSDSEINNNDSPEIICNQMKNERLYESDKGESGKEEGELSSSDDSVIIVGETKRQCRKSMKRKRQIFDCWEDKELSLVDSIAEMRNKKLKSIGTKQKMEVDKEMPYKESRKLENIFEVKKSKMADYMHDILNNCFKSGNENSNAKTESRETSRTPESVSESDRKPTTENDREKMCRTRSESDNSNELSRVDTFLSPETECMDLNVVDKEMVEDQHQVVGLISLPNELPNLDESKIKLQSSDFTLHSTNSGMMSSRKDLSEKGSLSREETGRCVERHSEFEELPSQKRSDSQEEEILTCEPMDQLGVLSPRKFSCPIQQRLSPLSEISLSEHDTYPQLELQHPSVNLHPQLETQNVLNVNASSNSFFLRHERPMFNNYNFNFGPVHHHNYLMQQVNPVFNHQMYQQQRVPPVTHRNIHINPAMILPRRSPNQNFVLMQRATNMSHFIPQPSIASTPSSSRSVSPTSPNYSHRLVSDRDPLLSDSAQQMAPDYSPKTLMPRRPMVEDFVSQNLMMPQNQNVYLKDVMTSPNMSVEDVLKKREQDVLIPQDLQKSKLSIPPLNSESLYLKESMKTKLSELTNKARKTFSDVVNEATTSENCTEARNITPTRPASQENFRPIYPKPFSSVNCVIMLEDYFILHRSLEVLEALFLQLSHSLQGWKVFIHAGVISLIEKRSKCGIFDATTVEAMQRFALVEKYKVRGLIVLVNTCRCNPNVSLLEEKAVCLKQIQSVLYPQSAHTVLITDFVNNMQQLSNGLIISSLDPFYKRFCSR